MTEARFNGWRDVWDFNDLDLSERCCVRPAPLCFGPNSARARGQQQSTSGGHLAGPEREARLPELALYGGRLGVDILLCAEQLGQARVSVPSLRGPTLVAGGDRSPE